MYGNKQYKYNTMYGNDRQLNPLHSVPWDNGNQKPNLAFPKYLSQLKDDNLRQEEKVKSLERATEALKARKKELEDRAAKIAECQMMFRKWSGFEFKEYTDQSCHVSFPVFRKGTVYAEYSIRFVKGPDGVWVVYHHMLPFNMKHIPQDVKKAQINNLDKLINMIRKMQFEVFLFNCRGEQFDDAKELASHTLRIHPSLNTLAVLLEVYIEDRTGSDLSTAYVYLSYGPTKFLPNEPKFRFIGGSKEDREELKNQLAYLEYQPLKAALTNAFYTADESKMSTDFDKTDTCLKTEVPHSNQKDFLESQAPVSESESKSSVSPPPLFSPPVKLERQTSTTKRGVGMGRGRGSRGGRGRNRI